LPLARVFDHFRRENMREVEECAKGIITRKRRIQDQECTCTVTALVDGN